MPEEARPLSEGLVAVRVLALVRFLSGMLILMFDHIHFLRKALLTEVAFERLDLKVCSSEVPVETKLTRV